MPFDINLTSGQPAMRLFTLLIQPRARLAAGVVSALISCGAHASTISIGGYDDFFRQTPNQSISISSYKPIHIGIFGSDIQISISGSEHDTWRDTQRDESPRHRTMSEGIRQTDAWGDTWGNTRNETRNIHHANFDNFRPTVSDNERHEHFDHERWHDVSAKHCNSMFRLFYPEVTIIVRNDNDNRGHHHHEHGPDNPDIHVPEHGQQGDSDLPKPVPLPAAAWLFGSGMVALSTGLRRKRKTPDAV
jgi:hypothetical protein